MTTLNSRYDYYTESDQFDSETNEKYPDPLSVNYSKGHLTQIPTKYKIEAKDMEKWWLMQYNKYGRVDEDDLLMNINAVPYEGMLEPGSTIYFPQECDLTGWLTNQSQN